MAQISAEQSNRNNNKKDFIVGVLFEADVNWPEGRLQFGNSVLGRVTSKSGLENPLVLLARRVKSVRSTLMSGRDLETPGAIPVRLSALKVNGDGVGKLSKCILTLLA